MSVARFLLASLVLAAAAPASGQAPPPRPRIAPDADTNDWEAYFDHGVKTIGIHPNEAREAFRWASRINPERAEPLFAFWVTLRLVGQGPVGEAVDQDSVRLMALVRNPFVHRGLEAFLYTGIGELKDKNLTKGWVAYAESNFPRAIDLLGQGIRRDPEKYAWFRVTRAQAFIGLRQFDSALVEVQTLLDELERRDTGKLVVLYESKSFVHYAIGLLETVRGRHAEARESMGRALLENMGFYPAHLFLGSVALDTERWGEAVTEFQEALVTKPGDPVLYFRYGRALAQLGRGDEAIIALREAVRLAPFYAAPWLFLGRLLESKGDSLGAVAVYRVFINRTVRSDPNLALARTWAANLQAAAR